ncbi:hypothetical protein GE21DRAFT_10632 [Neurospora crassa]|uniref:Oxidase ustYa n=1 Tax=Neurospora crassa (strain ATCC 24698 / 74-OR23-1A / CBS 708.71 / DSM 1257 / FGSC 987) TaxID=367110 RepID=Q7S4Q7_NEUCR|nr:hypothetical protein NCU05766 [Neurospora crassa OR74A]EAA30505.2 hypothetical protein NCU05766 [Neurospora crassa OR74A]KHE86656.1 hypothetical protein GE21DRAFT_10632 [Neurospora crassa]|eukprot:XP_959741.2 hypothetical protein NCU05766 [Neurospora crassa OR74A]
MDHYRDDQSSTTVRSSASGSNMVDDDMEEKENLLESNPPRTPGKRTNTRRGRLMILSLPCTTFFLALSNVLSLAALVAVTLRPIATTTTVPVSSTTAEQPPRQYPEQPPWEPQVDFRTEIFRFQTIYGAEPSEEVDQAWTAMIPKGKGFILLPNETSEALPDLPRLDKSNKQQHAMISVFHQLHCLYMTRAGYFAAKSGNLDEVNTPHLTHCWDYLRQGIMCNADTTLEWITYPDESGSTGWGYQHTCKDFGAVFEWAERHRFREWKVIH